MRWLVTFVVSVSITLGAWPAMGEVHLNLAAPPGGIYLGEPLIVKVCVKNETSDTLWLAADFDSPSGLTDYTLTDPSGADFDPQGLIHHIDKMYLSTRGPHSIPPGDLLYDFVAVMYFAVRSRKWLRPNNHMTGEYTISASYRFRGVSLQSEPVRFMVKRPPLDQLNACWAFASLHRPERTVLLPANDEWPSCPREAYERFLIKWPRSVYSKYARYYVARFDQCSKNCEKAVEEYQRLLDEYEPTSLSELAEIRIAECQATRPQVGLDLLRSLPASYQGNVNFRRLKMRYEWSIAKAAWGDGPGTRIPPMVSREAYPVYPERALAVGIEGTVDLLVCLNELGEIGKVKIEHSDNDALNEAALEAASRYEFTAAMLYGIYPVRSTISISIEFSPDAWRSQTQGLEIEKGLHYLTEQDDYPSAAECFRRAISKDEESWEGHFLLGKAYACMGVVDRAWYYGSRAYYLASAASDKDRVLTWMEHVGLSMIAPLPPDSIRQYVPQEGALPESVSARCKLEIELRGDLGLSHVEKTVHDTDKKTLAGHPASTTEVPSPPLPETFFPLSPYPTADSLERPDVYKVRYPMLAREEGVTGTVIVMAQIDETGRVIDAWIRQSHAPVLSDAALEAVYRWRFSPHRPVKAIVSVPFRFPPPEKDPFGNAIGDSE